METVNYKVGDIVELADGVRYVYHGFNRELRSYVYEPTEPRAVSIYCTLAEEECVKYGYNKGTVSFAWKMYVNVTEVWER